MWRTNTKIDSHCRYNALLKRETNAKRTVVCLQCVRTNTATKLGLEKRFVSVLTQRNQLSSNTIIYRMI